MTGIDTQAAPASLTADEVRWLACWRRMDDRRRRENLDLAELDAAAHPRLRAAPSLTLVDGGVS